MRRLVVFVLVQRELNLLTEPYCERSGPVCVRRLGLQLNYKEVRLKLVVWFCIFRGLFCPLTPRETFTLEILISFPRFKYGKLLIS